MNFGSIVETLKDFAFPKPLVSPVRGPVSPQNQIPVSQYPGYQQAQQQGSFTPPQTLDFNKIGNFVSGLIPKSTYSFHYNKPPEAPIIVNDAPARTPAPVVSQPSPLPSPTGDALWSQFTRALIPEAEARGYDPSVLLRQKALESAYGTSNFAQNRLNFGGMGAYDSNPDQAFKFNTIQDYLKSYFDLIQSRYPKAYEQRSNPQAYVEALKQGGYASDPQYVWKVLNTPIKYEGYSTP